MKKRCLPGLLSILANVLFATATAQLCGHPADTLYGLNSISGSSGQIVAINVNNAGATTIGSAPSGSANANGLGYSAVNGRFYFFNQTGSGTTEFISYIPSTGTKVTLAAPPATIQTTHKIRSGTVDSAGTRYYTINPNAAVPYFYYYSIGSNSWTTITSTFKDVSGNTITDFKNLTSGDMTFDGAGNLWVLCSSTSQFALYKISAPVPTSVVTSITADTILPIQSNPISGVSFTGIGFNSAGQLYLTTGSGVGSGNNKLYKLATTGSSLSLVGSVPNGYGDDLTTCTYPMAVLGVAIHSFAASLRNGTARLSWSASEGGGITGYRVERSPDAASWEAIGYVKAAGAGNGPNDYNFNDPRFSGNKTYYRIVQQSASGKEHISETKLLESSIASRIRVGPNPARDFVKLYHKEANETMLARIFDSRGRLILSKVLGPDEQTIDISQLNRGNFILLLSVDGENTSPGYHFVKW